MLRERLQELFQYVCGGPDQPPPPSLGSVLIAELHPDDFDGNRPRIGPENFRSAEDYEVRFEELMTMGFAWVNMNYCGVLRGQGLILVECPKSPARARGPTSINYSGPPKLVADAGWDALAYIILT